MLPSEYISTYSKETTRRIRKSGVLKYLRMYLRPDVLDIDAGMEEYLSTRNSADVARDLTRFYAHADVQALAPMTRASYLSSIECYFQDACDFRLTGLQRKLRERSKREKTAAVLQEISPTREIWQAVLSHLGVRHRAELLLCLSGGLRIGEVLSLWLSDVHLDETPCRIELRGTTTKNGLPRRTFCSREAADALRAYLRVRDADVARGLAKCQNCSIQHDLREVFPMNYRNENRAFWHAIDVAGYGQRDIRTERRMLHIHSARKWFLTQAKKNARADFVEAWAGHTGYLSSAYHRPTLEEERAEYLKCEPTLSINVPDDYLQMRTEQATEIERMKSTLLAQQELIARMQEQMLEVKNRQAAAPIIAPFASYLPDAPDE